MLGDRCRFQFGFRRVAVRGVDSECVGILIEKTEMRG